MAHLMRNICEKCKTENPLGANLCNVCNSTIKPINDNEQLILRAPEGKHTRKKLQLWHAASTEDSRRYASVIIHNDQHNLINIIPILMLC